MKSTLDSLWTVSSPWLKILFFSLSIAIPFVLSLPIITHLNLIYLSYFPTFDNSIYLQPALTNVFFVNPIKELGAILSVPYRIMQGEGIYRENIDSLPRYGLNDSKLASYLNSGTYINPERLKKIEPQDFNFVYIFYKSDIHDVFPLTALALIR